MVNICTTYCDITQICTTLHSAFMLCAVLKIRIDYFPEQHKSKLFCSGGGSFSVRQEFNFCTGL